MTDIATYDPENCALTINAGGYERRLTAAEIADNWNALSHFPERRAAHEVQFLGERLNAFAAYLDDISARGGQIDRDAEMEAFARRHVDLTRAYWSAEGRCASWFIVGPAKFPTARNQKRLDAADNRRHEVEAHATSARQSVKRRAWPHGAPGEAIRSSNPDAPDLLRREIAKREAQQEKMKAANAAIRRAKSDDPEALIVAVMDATGFRRDTAAKIITPNYMGQRGFESFSLSNNLAEIKRLKARLAGLETKRATGTTQRTEQTTAGEVEVVENVEADRIQLVFPGKPDDATRAALKGRGFRWSPREGAWQRHLNNAGRYAAEMVLRELAPAAE